MLKLNYIIKQITSTSNVIVFFSRKICTTDLVSSIIYFIMVYFKYISSTFEVVCTTIGH